jgi:ABC-type amino acid transport substrate-binding protein
VLRREPRFEGIHELAQFLALPPDQLAGLRIGVYDRSPAAQWLTRHDLLPQAVPYPMLSADPDWYPGRIIEQDLAQGRLDAAIVWGPVAGYYARRAATQVLPPIPWLQARCALRLRRGHGRAPRRGGLEAADPGPARSARA